MLLARTCPVCRVVGEAPCRRCVAQLRPAPEWDDPSGVIAAAVALFAYDGGVGTKLVAALKFHNHRDALVPLAEALAAVVPLAVPEGRHLDRVTWVPTTSERRRRRGFDQAEMLARSVARAMGLRCDCELVRRTAGSQTGADRSARASVAFEPRRRLDDTSGGVVLVDDVRTTGFSLRSAAGSLRVAGAPFVIAATLAATP